MENQQPIFTDPGNTLIIGTPIAPAPSESVPKPIDKRKLVLSIILLLLLAGSLLGLPLWWVWMKMKLQLWQKIAISAVVLAVIVGLTLKFAQ